MAHKPFGMLEQIDITELFPTMNDLPTARREGSGEIITAVNELYTKLIENKGIKLGKTTFGKIVMSGPGVTHKRAVIGYQSAMFITDEAAMRVLLAVQEHVEASWSDARAF